jgi:hypothetical protein
MSRLTFLALASALTLGAAAGMSGAQTAADAPPAPSAQTDAGDCGPGAMRDGCEMDRDGMGMHEDSDHHSEGWGHHRDKHARKVDRHGDRRDGHERHGPGRMMRIIDANADGVIGDDEAAALAEFAFRRLDDNRDEAVSEAEFSEGRGHGRHGGWFRWLAKEEAEAVLKVRKDRFVALDSDKNGSVSKTEFLADAKAKLAAADTDKDGKVTPWEFRSSFSPMN